MFRWRPPHLVAGAHARGSVPGPSVTLPGVRLLERDAALGVLVERFGQARDGSGGIVLVSGEAGAGKSTLLKLLCRFYDPSAGTVTLDGIDIRRFRVEDLRSSLSVMFQWPVSYQATARDNIGFGAASGAPPRASEHPTRPASSNPHPLLARTDGNCVKSTPAAASEDIASVSIS